MFGTMVLACRFRLISFYFVDGMQCIAPSCQMHREHKCYVPELVFGLGLWVDLRACMVQVCGKWSDEVICSQATTMTTVRKRLSVDVMVQRPRS